jgi:hypothetical protein
MFELKSLTPRRLQLALIALPLALGLLYYAVFAAERYVSESTVALRQAGNDAAAALPGAALLLAGLNPGSREDTCASTSSRWGCCRSWTPGSTCAPTTRPRRWTSPPGCGPARARSVSSTTTASASASRWTSCRRP